MLLGHIVCKEGFLVHPTKIMLILNFPPPTDVKQLRVTLVHTRYYRKFIRGYATITTPMEKLLKKDALFEWSNGCLGSFYTLKIKMDTTPILVFLDWAKEFHVHVDAWSIMLGVVLVQVG